MVTSFKVTFNGAGTIKNWGWEF